MSMKYMLVEYHSTSTVGIQSIKLLLGHLALLLVCIFSPRQQQTEKSCFVK